MDISLSLLQKMEFTKQIIKGYKYPSNQNGADSLTHLEASRKNSIHGSFHRLLCKDRPACRNLAIAVSGGCGLGSVNTITPHSGDHPGVSPQPLDWQSVCLDVHQAHV